MTAPPPRTGFLASKFIQNQFLALARNSVVSKPVLAMYGSYLKNTGASAVVAVEDKGGSSTNSNSNADDDPDLNVDPNTRILFAVRPPPHIVGGVVGCCWNIALGQIGAPMVGLAVFWTTMSRCAHGRYIGALWGVGGGLFWASCFAVLGGVSGVQQLIVGAANQAAGPYYSLVASGTGRKFWSGATCRFVSPRVTAQPEVNMYRDNSELVLEAMRRQCARNRKVHEERGFETKFDRDGNLSSKGSNKSAPKREKTYYEILEVNSKASDREIKDAYARLAMKLHPDRNPSPKAHEEFDTLTKAYRTIGNAEKRRRYDAAGVSGADDVGSKKRTAVRSFFGGDDLAALVGDVRRNNFNRRFIDETDFAVADLCVLNERIEDGCVREMLDKYLAGFPLDPRIVAAHEAATAGTAANGNGSDASDVPMEARLATYEADRRDWEQRVKKQILKYANVALAKEVMYAVGHQYLLSVQLAAPSVPHDLLPSVTAARLEAASASSADNASTDKASTSSSSSTSKASGSGGNKKGGADKLFDKPSPIRHTGKDRAANTNAADKDAAPMKLNLSGGVVARASLYATVVLPRFAEQNAAKLTQAFKLNPSAKDPAVIMDFIWRLSVTELQQTAHKVATRVVCDVDASDLERRRRLSALVELALIFVRTGKPYATVDKRTMEMMNDSLRDYYSKTGKSQ